MHWGRAAFKTFLEVFNARSRLLQSLIQLLIDEDVVLVAIFKMLAVFLEVLVVDSDLLNLVVQILH